MNEDIVMPAGEYWLGDPCYVVPADEWEEYINLVFLTPDEAFEFKDFKCVAFSTANGDGTYPDQFENEYDVDSGLIGLTPVAVYKDSRGCRLVRFDKPFTCRKDGSLLTFGYYEIATCEDETDSTDEEDFYYSEYDKEEDDDNNQ